LTEVSVIRVLTVDDHPLMVAGLAGEINAQPDMKVVAQAADGIEAISRFREHCPDITLMDLRMPNGDGIQAIERIKSEKPDARIVVLSTCAGDMHAMRALRAGADGYLLKNTLRTQLIDTIRAVHGGQRRIPPEIAQRIAEHALDETLTPREQEVLRGVAGGNSNKRIAQQMGLSENTINNYLKNILAKLRARDRTHAVIIALERGFMQLRTD
jgi:DNA-binding NarL/FixJ family response regulator